MLDGSVLAILRFDAGDGVQCAFGQIHHHHRTAQPPGPALATPPQPTHDQGGSQPVLVLQATNVTFEDILQ